MGYKKHNIDTYEKDYKKILLYVSAIFKVKNIITVFKPDILHAHFATSYGLLGALSMFHPFIISMWGYDVIDFPLKSTLHRKLIEFNLRMSNCILSTSHFMAGVAKQYTQKEIKVTPFGIDTNIFKPQIVKSLFGKEDIVVGTIKTLDDKYGIEYLIRAFKILKEKHNYLPLKLLIVGGGPQEGYLKKLAKELHIWQDTVFTGYISYDQVPLYYNMLSVYVALSVLDGESFGVAILEASASEIPVVVSDVGGLPEVVQDNVTGFIIPRKNHQAAAEAIEKLILDSDLRNEMGKNGRRRVEEHYNWQNNVDDMVNIYQEVVGDK